MFILKKLGIEGMYFNAQKTTYDQPIGIIILNGGKQIISSKIRKKTWMYTLPTLIYYSTGILSQYNKTGENKRDSIREEVKLPLFAGDMISYLKDPKNSNKLLDLINSF
jgi:hypothetical protein